ncbi:hypothetical protein Vadar_023967 [Vaccinium darrowii]|uniref:Uncharacterized protein n=1 Tax=Vaccinium darrowii TaxID=229202 RepID=A0ACB7YY62_9ERIC|nr:hypothetical protein Vadar_023967 [Vaccinium darrowii]
MAFNNPQKDEADQTRRLYNPYQDLQVPIQTLYKLPTSPEFLFQEESIAQRRSWGENLTYYTGIGYLGGATAGAAKGFVEGVRAVEAGDTMKLKVNRILNGSGHGGRKFGNRAGVIGLMYAGLESGMVAIRDTDDVVNSVVAGLGTGALYKAASGPRSAAVAGAIGGVVVGLAVTGKQFMIANELSLPALFIFVWAVDIWKTNLCMIWVALEAVTRRNRLAIGPPVLLSFTAGIARRLLVMVLLCWFITSLAAQPVYSLPAYAFIEQEDAVELKGPNHAIGLAQLLRWATWFPVGSSPSSMSKEDSSFTLNSSR